MEFEVQIIRTLEDGSIAWGGAVSADTPEQARADLATALRLAASTIEKGDVDVALGLGDGTVGGTGFTDAELKGGAA